MSILVCDPEEAAVIKSYREAVCWMSSHPGSVLVVREMTARLVDEHHRNDGLYFNAAKALVEDERRARWFDVEQDGGRRLLRLNAEGVMFHRQLIARHECTCH